MSSRFSRISLQRLRAAVSSPPVDRCVRSEAGGHRSVLLPAHCLASKDEMARLLCPEQLLSFVRALQGAQRDETTCSGDPIRMARVTYLPTAQYSVPGGSMACHADRVRRFCV